MLETKENGSIGGRYLCNVSDAIKRDQKSGSLIGASDLVSSIPRALVSRTAISYCGCQIASVLKRKKKRKKRKKLGNTGGGPAHQS